MRLNYCMVGLAQVRQEVLAFNVVAVVKNSAPHNVKQDIGEVTGVPLGVCGLLNTIGCRTQGYQTLGAKGNVLLYFLR